MALIARLLRGHVLRRAHDDVVGAVAEPLVSKDFRDPEI